MMTQKTETDHGMKAESGIIYSDDAADFVAVSEVVRDVILEIPCGGGGSTCPQCRQQHQAQHTSFLNLFSHKLFV